MAIGLPKINKRDGGESGGDEEAPVFAADTTKNKKSKNNKEPISLFPTPKQVVTIYSPIVHVITQEIDPEHGSVISSPQNSIYSGYIDGVWKGYTAPEATTVRDADAPKKKPRKIRRIKVKMGSLIIKMLNRLVRENVVAHERVYLSRTPTHLLVKILAGERTVNILLMRCERIGVGSVVGAAFGCGLEWSMAPNTTEEMQNKAATDKPFDLDKVGGGAGVEAIMAGPDGNGGGATATAATKTTTTTTTTCDSPVNALKETLHKEKDTPIVDHIDAVEEVSISSEDDVDDDEEGNANSLSAKAVRLVTGKSKAGHSPQSTKSYASSTEPLSGERRAKLGQLIADARREWLETGSRLRVAQVLENVEAGASFTFDYLWYVLLAAWVAGMGLISNSVAVVVASMLLSPLMGPCLGATMGATLKKRDLVWLGLRNECISLLLCILMGLIVALIAVPARTPSIENWPSAEMTNRGTMNGLVIGILVAIPSGMAVALSVLGRNSGGLTGVAISLSLLPPAVNAGLCWMTALLFKTGVGVRNEGDDTNYAFVGAMSLCLTLVNIACIFIGGISMFRLKEVAPVKNKNTFWSRDVKIARQKRRKAIEPNAKAIKLGIKAALELEEALAKEGKLHTDDIGRDQMDHEDEMRVAEARRHGLAADVVEDALFLGGGGFIAEEDVVPGGAAWDDLEPDEVTFLDEKSDVDSDKASLLGVAEKVGGLQDAGELLFAPYADAATNLASRTNAWDDRLGDYGIDHEDVAGAVLLS